MFCHFWQNSKIQNGRHFWGGEIFLKIANITFLRYPVGRKFSTKSLYLGTVKEIEANLCFAIFVQKFEPFLAKIRKFKMAAIFGEGKIFGKLQRLHSLDTLWVENFDEIALSRTVKEIEANLLFCHFWQKFENSKWPPFLGRGKFFENCKYYIP